MGDLGVVPAEQAMQKLCWPKTGPCYCLATGRKPSYACLNGTSGTCQGANVCNGFGNFNFSTPPCGPHPTAALMAKVPQSSAQRCQRAEAAFMRKDAAKAKQHIKQRNNTVFETRFETRFQTVKLKSWARFEHVNSTDALIAAAKKEVRLNLAINLTKKGTQLKTTAKANQEAAEEAEENSEKLFDGKVKPWASFEVEMSLMPSFSFQKYPLELEFEEVPLEVSFGEGEKMKAMPVVKQINNISYAKGKFLVGKAWFTDKERFERSEAKDWKFWKYNKIRGVTGKLKLGIWYEYGYDGELSLSLGAAFTVIPKFKKTKKECEEDGDDDPADCDEDGEEEEEKKDEEKKEEEQKKKKKKKKS